MTKKDFELIANAINSIRTTTIRPSTSHYFAALDDVSLEFAERLKQVNPRFDKERFLKACGALND